VKGQYVCRIGLGYNSVVELWENNIGVGLSVGERLVLGIIFIFKIHVLTYHGNLLVGLLGSRKKQRLMSPPSQSCCDDQA
jgi:hypothetical protein